MKKMTLIIASAVMLTALTGCMSDNKAWLRAKELELKAEAKTQQNAKTTVEGPAEVKLEQGGKVVFEAGK